MTRVLRSLVLMVLIATGVAAVPARAHPPGQPDTRLAVLTARPGVLDSPFPASHIGVRWRGTETAPVEVRAGRPGRMGPWRPMAVSHDLGDEERGIRFSGLLRADGATRVQARAGDGASGLQVVVIDAVSGFDAAPDLGLPTAGPGSSGPSQPNVISRPAWGADEGMRKGDPEFAPISKLIVHHTVTENNDPDPASTVRAIYAYHTRGNGWNDIGYNFLVDAQGRIYEGRFARSYDPGEIPTGEDHSGRGVIGAHAKSANQGSAGVALLGDFSGGGQPTGAALDALVRLLAWKAGRHGINPEASDPYTGADGSTRSFPNIGGHRDVGQTACPGDRLYERLPEVRHRVAETMAMAPTAPAPPGPPVQPPVPLPGVPGFWSATGAGHVRAYGDAPAMGDLSGRRVNAPIVSLAATPGGRGYWLAGADGGVFAFGDARFLGGASGLLTVPAVDLEPTPTGKGYWVLSRAGEIVAFGDAVFRGSTALLPFEVVDMASTPTGQGYWVASTDGRVFAFGDAVLQRATAGAGLVSGGNGEAAPMTGIVAIAAHPDGRGYWLLGQDGGVFAFDVPFHGSVPGRRAYHGAVELRATETGGGYYVAGEDGAVFAFGDADGRRERPGQPDEGGVVDFALRPAGGPRHTEPAGPPAAPAPPEAPGLPGSPAPPGSPEAPERAVLTIR
jgi:hypothetical protein